MNWTQAKDLRLKIQKLWNNGSMLRAMVDGTRLFPKRLSLKGPSTQDLTEHFEEVRHWIAALQQGACYRLEMQTIRHRILGKNDIPKAAWIDHLEDALSMIEKHKEARWFAGLVKLTHARRSGLMEWVERNPLKALSFSEDWPQILDIVDWLVANPNPGIYLRQVDLPGIHSKFIETHRGVLTSLLDLSLPHSAIHHQYNGIGEFSLRYGFLEKSSRIRFRVLDPQISFFQGPNQDITITQETCLSLETDPRVRGKIQRIFITENEINFLAFPALPKSIVIFGAGYGFDFLSDIPWIAGAAVYYWGDIDTHGFAILDQLRVHLPHAQSILMDKATLIAHRSFWVKEDRQETRNLSRLTQVEQQLYDDLRNHRLSKNLRLEQERIGFKWVSHHLFTL